MKAELWERGTKAPVGSISLRDGELTIDASDGRHRAQVEQAFATADITYAYARYGEGDSLEFKAERMTPRWFAAVLLLVLAPEGYRWNFTEIDDDF